MMRKRHFKQTNLHFDNNVGERRNVKNIKGHQVIFEKKLFMLY